MSTSKEPVYCLCGQPYDPERFMIQCDVCKDWFHGSAGWVAAELS
ncbi:lysine-specific demethylase 7B-like [Tropilaelaps mercedesae]|uniref:Lysine-specific demethylase 7B-like n=1 Tax=Tropilaelaps mercedesae TaxID=418985 RepID=A0A1V9X655_9ACAR|nr:lysine-specific demethylase 7B-like [Tropilaelaps mercedesae]